MDFSTVISLTALVTTVVIAIRQHAIAKRTLFLTENIETRKKTQRRLSLFLDKHTTWQVHLPVSYHQRPLPLVAAGDYFAMHVLTSLLGEDRSTIEFVNTNPDVESSQEHDNNSLFLCSPKVNKGLGAIYPIFEENQKTVAAFQSDTKLPCWFQSDHRDSGEWSCIRSLLDDDLPPVIAYAANQTYAASAKLKPGHRLFPIPHQRDHAILARLNAGSRGGPAGRLDIVMAGIHQFGTWIVADFVEQLVRGREVNYMEFLLDCNYEFVAVIDGVFAPEQLRVVSSSMRDNYFWYRKTGDVAWIHAAGAH